MDRFELSWLNLRGKPQVALAHFTIPCKRPNTRASPSSLYLNSFNNSRFADAAAVLARLRADIAQPCGAAVTHPAAGVKMLPPEQFDRRSLHELDGLSLTGSDIECTTTRPRPSCCAPTPASRS